ncbi:mediator of RNA polymerase II transcription subunit 13 [Trichonephila clavipes]|nr:mediator of RNA polymerase II transcription subunit 13 [Trichonephila clavipes]
MRVPMMQIGGNRKEPSLANKPHALRVPSQERLNDVLGRFSTVVSSPFQNVANMVENIKIEIKEEDSSNSQNNSTVTSNGLPSNSSSNWTQEPVEETKPAIAPSSVSSMPAPTLIPVQGLKRPSLTVCSYDDPHDELVMDGLLYDYTFLSNSLWENTSSKRRKLWPDKRIKTETLESGDQYFYGKDSLSIMQIDENQSLKAKDPYEFNDEFDEDSPSSTGFRARLDDEDIKPKDPALPPTPDSQILTPGQVISAPLTPIQDPPKPPSNGEQPSSPLTPRNQGSSFTSEKDLQVTDKDLDNLFESSSSDDSADDVVTAATMAGYQDLSEFKHGVIVDTREMGHSISKVVMKFGFSPTAISQVYHEYWESDKRSCKNGTDENH